MMSIQRLLTTGALVAGAFTALPAAALTVSFGGTTSEGQNSFSYVVNDGGTLHTVKVTAFYSTSQVGNSAFQAAKVNRYSAGLGVRAPGESTSAPYHAIDNSSGVDYLLIDFGASFKASSFKIGYEGSSNSSSFESSPDVQVWTGGGTGALSLLNDCVTSGCGVGGATLAAQGFAKLTQNSDVAVGTWTSLTGPTAGRYAIFSAALGTQETCRSWTGSYTCGLDAFKLTSVQGVYTPPVPEPSTYALMAAGLGAIGFVARRRSRQQA